MEISFAAEKLGYLGPLPITNALITSLLTSTLLVFFALYVRRYIAIVPSRLQNVTELVIDGFYTLNVQLAGKRAAFIFPWFATFFLFIIVANWLGLLPGFGTVGFFKETTHHFVPLLRSVNSDLNTTLALALISLVLTHFFSIRTIGMREYVSRFFSANPINLFVGLLELISEFTKIASLSFRLFGNIFAGEALLITISSLFAFVVPLPFMVLEVIVGFVQALIFSMLTLVFMVILSTSHKASH